MPWTPKPARERARRPSARTRPAATSSSPAHGHFRIHCLGHPRDPRTALAHWPRARQPARAQALPCPALPRRRPIAQLPPDADYRQVAQAARVSPQAAHRMLKTAPRMGDVAAAADSLSVLKVIPLPCAHCRRPFTPDSPTRVDCRPACQQAAAAAASTRPSWTGATTAPRPPTRSTRPCHPAAAASAGLQQGALRHHAPGPAGLVDQRDPRRARGRRPHVQGCPVRPDCTQWSLALPLSDPAIYGGISQRERPRRRREWLAAVTANPQPPVTLAAARHPAHLPVPGARPAQEPFRRRGLPAPPARHASPSPLFRGPRYNRNRGWQDPGSGRPGAAPRPGSNLHARVKRILGT